MRSMRNMIRPRSMKSHIEYSGSDIMSSTTGRIRFSKGKMFKIDDSLNILINSWTNDSHESKKSA